MFRHATWCSQTTCYPKEALAVTSVFAENSTGHIKDADVEINGVNFTWADVAAGGQAAVNAQDVQNVLAHEFGHFIGLDHTCRTSQEAAKTDNAGKPVPLCQDASSAVLGTTMVALVRRGDTQLRTLADDDIRAVCDTYPGTAAGACVVDASAGPESPAADGGRNADSAVGGGEKPFADGGVNSSIDGVMRPAFDAGKGPSDSAIESSSAGCACQVGGGRSPRFAMIPLTFVVVFLATARRLGARPLEPRPS
jgi:hypothetical protein